MKKLILLFVFATAVAGSFAFKARTTTTTAFYEISGNCNNSAQTNENGCTTTGLHAQCTVNVSGNPLAWNQSDCTDALKLP